MTDIAKRIVLLEMMQQWLGVLPDSDRRELEELRALNEAEESK